MYAGLYRASAVAARAAASEAASSTAAAGEGQCVNIAPSPRHVTCLNSNGGHQGGPRLTAWCLLIYINYARESERDASACMRRHQAFALAPVHATASLSL